MKVEVDLTITNAIISNNVFKSLIGLSIGYYTQGGTLYAFLIITSIMHYSQTCKPLQVFLFIYQLAFSFIYVIAHKFILVSIRKLCRFFPWFLMGGPLLLFLSQPQSKVSFVLRQITVRLTLNDPTAFLIL